MCTPWRVGGAASRLDGCDGLPLQPPPAWCLRRALIEVSVATVLRWPPGRRTAGRPTWSTAAGDMANGVLAPMFTDAKLVPFVGPLPSVPSGARGAVDTRSARGRL